MKSLLYFLMLLPFAVQAQKTPTNQNLFDTIPFIPDHTPQRLAVFQKEPIVTGRIIFLGNSITEMGNWKKLLNDSTVINRGIGGDITYGILKRLKDVTDRQPSKLFILCGINDIGKDIPDSVIANNMLKIVNRVHAACPQTKIYVESVLPVNPTMPHFPQHYDKEEHVLILSKLYKDNAKVGNYTFINISRCFGVKISASYRSTIMRGYTLNRKVLRFG